MYLLDWVPVLLLMGAYVALLRRYGSTFKVFIGISLLMSAAVMVLKLVDVLLAGGGAIYRWGLATFCASAICWIWVADGSRRQSG